MGDGRFKPGQVANPDGRPVGSRNKRTTEISDKLTGERDPSEFLAKLVADKTKSDDLRLAASVALMPHKCAKFGLVPAPPPLVYVTEPIELPHPHVVAIEHCVANIEHISDLRRTAKFDQDTADRLVAEQRILRDSLIEEAKLLVAQGGPRDQTIRIEGGLPLPLPGTNTDFSVAPGGPPLPGAPYPAVVNGQAVRDGVIGPPVPFIPPDGSPLAEKPGPPEPPPHLRKPEGDDPAFPRQASRGLGSL